MTGEKFRACINQKELTILCNQCNQVMKLRCQTMGSRSPFFQCGRCRLEVEITPTT